MDRLTLVAVPLLGLAYLTVTGAGLAAALAPRLPRDAQGALAPVCGAALAACASVLLPLDVPAKLLVGAVAALTAGVGLVFRREATAALRAGALPLGVAVAAIALVAVPGLARGDWRVTSLYGSTDSYHWASQARAYLEDPAPKPETEHPDRVTYERSRSQHWAVALPFGLLQMAWLSGSDPAEAYGALAALVFCLLPLATFALARGCLGWRAAPAALAGLLVALNGALLYASHFSWQQQLAGSAFAVGAAAMLYLGLEESGRTAELGLAAFLTAAALATYRLGFAPYLAALLGTVIAAQAVVRRAQLRAVAARAGVFALLAVVLGAFSVAAVARGLPDFFSSGGFSTAFKRAFPSGQVAEALGLVPRVWAVKQSWPEGAELAWLAAASVLAASLVVTGALAVRRVRPPRWELLAAGAAFTLVGYAVLLLPGFASYLSFKILSYGAPFLVLLALAPYALLGRTAVAVALTVLAVPSAVVATVSAIGDERPPQAGAQLSAAARRLPADAVIRVDVDDPWQQAWALYYLRDRRVSVERPSYLLTEQGRSTPAEAYRRRPVTYELRDDSGFVLRATP